MSWKNIIVLLIIYIKAIISKPSCTESENNCIKCHPITNICLVCINEVYTPDENGGCIGAKKCTIGKNYCNQCNTKGNLCLTCEPGYFPDENGGCSYTGNCEISYKGDCLECISDFILLGEKVVEEEDDLGLVIEKEYRFKICKYLYSDDLKNCQTINNLTGFCEECEDGYYLNSGDKRCLKTENCLESIFGVCITCKDGYYLNKKEDKCIKKVIGIDKIFMHCKETIDGKTCDVCEDGYYFSEVDKNCVYTNFCYKSILDMNCGQCIQNYYLTLNFASCANSKHCLYGDRDIGLCQGCESKFYLDNLDRQCKSNEENNEYQHCQIADELCLYCVVNYYLGEDSKCSTTQHCFLSNNGTCQICSENYYLGLDHKCSSTEHCIYTNTYSECIECEDNYYYDKNNRTCKESVDNFINCKYSTSDGQNCSYCKDDYYLSSIDQLCYDNTQQGPLYKCAHTDSEGELCELCINNYYLTSGDLRCTTVFGCKISENENRCLDCDENFCLDMKTGLCEINEFVIEDENWKKIYFRCNLTNDEGTACEICQEDFVVSEEGLCYDEINCEQKKEGICTMCKSEGEESWFSYCLNNDYGCVETYAENCLRCDNYLDFDWCTECRDGYVLTKDGECENSTYY